MPCYLKTFRICPQVMFCAAIAPGQLEAACQVTRLVVWATVSDSCWLSDCTTFSSESRMQTGVEQPLHEPAPLLLALFTISLNA